MKFILKKQKEYNLIKTQLTQLTKSIKETKKKLKK